MTAHTRLSQGISEIVLIVEDVPRAARFYRDVLGLIPIREVNEEWAWFWAGEPGVVQRIALHRGTLLYEEKSPLPPGRRFGRVHYAFQVARADLERAAERVRSAGVEVFGPMRLEWMGALSYYFYDPDGNLLEWWSKDPEAEE